MDIQSHINDLNSNNEDTIRLQKYLSDSGVSSRRGACSIIASGRVRVNNETVLEPGTRIRKDSVVSVDGKIISIPEKKVYYLLYKPRGMLTSMKDPNHECCVGDHVKELPFRVFPVGRLDKESEGLLLLTNDGDLANNLLHPKHHVKKLYSVVVTRQLTTREESAFRKGVWIHNHTYHTRTCTLERKGKQPGSDQQTYYVTIAEGKKRQIREMFRFFNVKVLSLKRIKMGNLEIGSLQPGEIRQLGETEINRLITRGTTE